MRHRFLLVAVLVSAMSALLFPTRPAAADDVNCYEVFVIDPTLCDDDVPPPEAPPPPAPPASMTPGRMEAVDAASPRRTWAIARTSGRRPTAPGSSRAVGRRLGAELGGPA